MSKAIPEKMFDVRVVKRNLEKGKISDKDYQNHLKSLTDMDGAFDTVDLSSPSSEETAAEGDPEIA